MTTHGNNGGATSIFDADGWGKEVREAREATKPTKQEEDRHFVKIRSATLAFGVLGVALASRGVVSPFSMLLICLFQQGQFCILAHHSLHGGWGVGRRGWFAKGMRRVVDWLDWIHPDAWNVEHNKHHHYCLGEDSDPDNPALNSAIIRSLPAPNWVRYFVLFLVASSWKWLYYASNTLKILHEQKFGAPAGAPKNIKGPFFLTDIVKHSLKGSRWHCRLMLDFIFRAVGPPFLVQYVMYPVLVGAVRGSAGAVCWYAVVNIAGAEFLANLLQFATIVTNHAGLDLWTFREPCKTDTAEFYLRAVLGSTAYRNGNDVLDFFHGWLCYQAEHHAFPALSPLHYQRLHPRFVAVCEKYQVPYVEDPVWTRVKKTADVFIGKELMPKLEGQAVDQPALWRAHAAAMKK